MLDLRFVGRCRFLVILFRDDPEDDDFEDLDDRERLFERDRERVRDRVRDRDLDRDRERKRDRDRDRDREWDDERLVGERTVCFDDDDGFIEFFISSINVMDVVFKGRVLEDRVFDASILLGTAKNKSNRMC